MKKKINYESFDGKFYRLEFIMRSKFNFKDINWHKSVVSLIMDNKYILVKRVSKEDNPTPIVRLGKDHLRCPRCDNKKCLTEGEMLTEIDYAIKNENEYMRIRKNKSASLKRHICACTSPKVKQESKLFILEYLERGISELITFDKTLRARHCLFCNARWDEVSFEATVTDNIYKKDGSKLLIVSLWCEVCGNILMDRIPLKQGQEIPKCKGSILKFLEQYNKSIED